MAMLRITTQEKISLYLDNDDLLTGCDREGLKLFKLLIDRYEGKTVSFDVLEEGLPFQLSGALKKLVDFIWPLSEGQQRRAMLYTLTLPYDVKEEDALLCLKKP